MLDPGQKADDCNGSESWIISTVENPWPYQCRERGGTARGVDLRKRLGVRVCVCGVVTQKISW